MANGLSSPHQNALGGYRSPEYRQDPRVYGLPRMNQYGQFEIGGGLGLDTQAGQLNAAFEILPGVGDYRALKRAGEALRDTRLVPDFMGGAKVETPRLAEGIFEGVTSAPVVGDAATLLKMGAVSLPGLLALMARRNADLGAKAMAPQARHIQGTIGSTGGEALSTGDDVVEGIEGFAEGVRKKYGLDNFDVYENKNGISLNMISVPKGARKQGAGSAAIEELTRYADDKGKRITLSVGQKDDGFGTTSRARLVKFYKRLGFVENKGRNKDFALPPGMYRDPIAQSLPSDTASRMARAEEMGFDLDNPITSSGEDITEIVTGYNTPGGGVNRFDGVFGSAGDRSKHGAGDIDTTFVTRRPTAGSRDVDLNYDQSIKTIKREYPDATDAEIDLIYEIAAEERNIFDMGSNPFARFGYDDLGEASWEGQRIRGRIAADQNFDAITMIDEHGESYLIPAGSKARSIKAQFDPTKKNSANLLAGTAAAAIGLNAMNREDYVNR